MSTKANTKPVPPEMRELLRSWTTVQSGLGKLEPKQLLLALKAEIAGKNRHTVVARIATHYDTRTKNERISKLIEEAMA